MKETLYQGNDDEICYPLDCWYDYLEYEQLDFIELIEMEEDKNNYIRWCSCYREFLEDGDECGKHCKDYIPQNGVKGKCVHKKFTYKETKNKITIHRETNQ